MSLDIRNLTPTFLDFWEQAGGQPRFVQEQLWHELYETPNQDVFDVYFSRYGRRANLGNALDGYDDVVARVAAITPEIISRAEQIAPKCMALVGKETAVLPLVLLVGVFNSDGWVTELNGTPTTFLALEVESNSKLAVIDVVLAHELTHGLHAQCCDLKINTTTVGEGLFVEGLAVLVSTLIVPTTPEVVYLCPGGGKTLTGQSCSDWLADCYQQLSFLCQELLRDLERADEERYASYFWSRQQTKREGVPLRAGYVIGYEIMKRLSQQHRIAELARWSSDQVMAAVRQQLQEMT